jgi:tetratricopeptide (TPR) repeat protein
MRERLIHDIVDRMLTDREFLTTFRHTPFRALRVYGLPGEDLDPAVQGAALADHDDDDERRGPGDTAGEDLLRQTTRAIAVGAADAQTFVHRGEALRRLGDQAGAARDYSRALDCGAALSADELAAAYDGRAACRLRLGDHSGAVADGERAVALAPRQARYHANLGRARRSAGDPAGALGDLDRALAVDPSERQAWHERGRCHQALGQHERALADFGHLLAIGRASYRALLARAQSHIALGNVGMALVECEIAAQQMPADDVQVYRLRGFVLYLIGDLYGALCDLSRAIGLGGESAELYLRRGLVYRALGDYRAAREDLSEFARRHPAGAAAALREIAAAIDAAGVAWPAALAA